MDTRLRWLAAIPILGVAALAAVAVQAQQGPPPPQSPPPDSLDVFEALQDHLENFDSVQAYFRWDDPKWLPRAQDPQTLLFGRPRHSDHRVSTPDAAPTNGWTLTARGDETVFLDHQRGGLERYFYEDSTLNRVAVQYEGGEHERVMAPLPGGDLIHTLWNDVRDGFENRTRSIRAPEQDGVRHPYEGRDLRWVRVIEPLRGPPDPLEVTLYFGMQGDGALEHLVLHVGDDWKWLKTGPPQWDVDVPEDFWNPFGVPSSTGRPVRKRHPPPSP